MFSNFSSAVAKLEETPHKTKKKIVNVIGCLFQVAKNRYMGDLGLIPLEFDKNSLCFKSKPKRSFKKKAKGETQSEEIPQHEIEDEVT